MRSTASSSKNLSVTIVANHAATLDGLEGYLRGAGVVTATTHMVDRILDVTPLSCVAVILFADEYGASGVTRALTALRRARPKVLPVIVTSEPLRFGGRSRRGVEGLAPLVIPKPPWAWTLLDAVRARFETSDVPSDAS
jgi:hypothetical protein